MKKQNDLKTNKRRVPAITLPERKALNYALVLAGYPHGENLASILRVMDFTILPHEIRTEDKPQAFSLFARKICSHFLQTLGLADSRQGASLHYCNKKPRAQVSGQSFASYLFGGVAEKTSPEGMT